MPTNRKRRSPQRRSTSLTYEQLIEITSGHRFFENDPQWEGFDPLVAWRQYRAVLFPIWVKHHPGRRPWAWWKTEATKPRRQVADGPESLPDKGTCYGKPGGHLGIPPEGMYESEAAYLSRLRLLVDGEAERIDYENLRYEGYTTEAFDAEAVAACRQVRFN